MTATPLQCYAEGVTASPVAGADLRAALVASCLRGALPPVDLRAVCLVRAMLPASIATIVSVGWRTRYSAH